MEVGSQRRPAGYPAIRRKTACLSLLPGLLLELNNFHERKVRLESELLAVVSRAETTATQVVSHAVKQIDRRNGDIRMRDLAASCNLSER